jgi:methyl coenzyme M reductase beta subunit
MPRFEVGPHSDAVAWFLWIAIAAVLLVAAALVLRALLDVSGSVLRKFGTAFEHALDIPAPPFKKSQGTSVGR